MASWAFEYVRHLSYYTGGARWFAVGGNHGGIKKEGVYVYADVEFNYLLVQGQFFQGGFYNY